jgi:phosphate transport system protein
MWPREDGETVDMDPSDPLARLADEQRTPSGARQEFQRQPAECDARLVAIGRQVAGAIVPITEAFLEADTHRAAELIGRDLNVERAGVELEEACYLLLARQAPVAGDLRRVVAILRSSADLQRSANLLRHVADSLTWVHPPSMPDELRQTVAQLGGLSAEIVGRAVEAWATHDGLAITELDARDDQVDLLQKWLLTELYTGTQSVEEAVSLALIARYYERVADHGVELARQVTYFLTGERTPLPQD